MTEMPREEDLMDAVVGLVDDRLWEACLPPRQFLYGFCLGGDGVPGMRRWVTGVKAVGVQGGYSPLVRVQLWRLFELPFGT